MALINVSIGELIDKITILEIKYERIVDTVKKNNVYVELNILNDAYKALTQDLTPHKNSLKTVNELLWDIENCTREKERLKVFDLEFIQFARSVYTYNDERAKIKRDINLKSGSYIIEEKEHIFKKAFFLGHLGLGDNILCIGLVRELAERYDEVMVVCKSHNIINMELFYRGNNKIKLFSVVDDNCISPAFGVPESDFKKITHGYDVYKAGIHNYKHVSDFPFSFYDDCGIARENLWKKFLVPLQKESRQLFDLVRGTKYAFIHNISSTNTINLDTIISKLNISDDTLIINPSVNPYSEGNTYTKIAAQFINHPLPNYIDTIINADKIFMIDSSFLCMSINCNINTDECYYSHRGDIDYFEHIYRDNNNLKKFKKLHIS